MIVEGAKRFLTVVGSSLGAITALFYAVGFLAETSKWVTLGAPIFNIVSQQYLYTGALFFFTLLPSAVTGITELLALYPLAIAVHVFIAILVAWLAAKAKLWQAALLIGEVFLLRLLVLTLAFSPDRFLGPGRSTGTRIALAERDLLFRIKSYVPPAKLDLEANYQVLVALFLLLLIAVVAIHLLGRVSLSTERAESPPAPVVTGEGTPKWLHQLARALVLARDLFSRTNSVWRAIHGAMQAVIMVVFVLIVLLMPLNFSNLLIYERFPIIDSKSVPEHLRPSSMPARYYLLRSSSDNLQVYVRSRDSTSVLVLDQDVVQDLRILGNKPIWTTPKESE